jgi:hypothetical protein
MALSTNPHSQSKIPDLTKKSDLSKIYDLNEKSHLTKIFDIKETSDVNETSKKKLKELKINVESKNEIG